MRSLSEEIDWHVMNDIILEEAGQYFSCYFNSIIDRTVPKSSNKKYQNIYKQGGYEIKEKSCNFGDNIIPLLIL